MPSGMNGLGQPKTKTPFDFPAFAKYIYEEITGVHSQPFLLPALYGGESSQHYEVLFVLQAPSVSFTEDRWMPCDTTEMAIQNHRAIFFDWAYSDSGNQAHLFRLLEFRGVGPKIATMAATTLARDFKVPLKDYYSLDISADVHVRRVFERLGLIESESSVERVVYRARALHPEFPGLLDLPAWEIGRNWCRPKSRNCTACYMRPACPSADEHV